MEKTATGMIISFLKSKKLSIILFVYLALTSFLAICIPQKVQPDVYVRQFGEFFSWLIKATGFNDFFHSLIFILPLILFIVNLGTTLAEHLYREFSGKTKKRFGPDFLYAGVLILITAGFISVQFSQQVNLRLEKGKGIEYGQRYLFTLIDAEQVRIGKNNAIEWIPAVEIRKDKKVLIGSAKISRLIPLTLDDLTITLLSFEEKPYLVLTDKKGEVREFPQGIPIKTSPYYVIFNKIVINPDTGETTIEFIEVDKKNIRNTFTLALNDSIEDYTISGIRKEIVIVLNIVKDPGSGVNLSGIIVAAIGLVLSIIQVVRDIRLKKTAG